MLLLETVEAINCSCLFFTFPKLGVEPVDSSLINSWLVEVCKTDRYLSQGILTIS